MTIDHDKQETRRTFLSAAARGAGLIGLGLFAAGSIQKRRRHVREGKCLDLQGRTGCQACRAFPACGLPRALSVRKVTGGIQ